MRLKLTLQYSGHPYGGWQYQGPSGTPLLPSVQGTVIDALNKLLEEATPLPPKALVGAGRTDAGVHAHAQVAHIDVPDTYQTRAASSWVTGLNRFLPLTIRVVGAEVVAETFHARFSATSRSYVYKVWLGRQLRPDLLNHAGHAPTPVDGCFNAAALQAAVASLPIGLPTNFNSLRDAQCQSKKPVCTLTHAHFTQREEDLWQLHIGADHFLHHMVRNLVGTLVQVALNGREPNLMPLLAAQDRTQAGTTFSPAGLYLTQVSYKQ